MVDTDLVRRDPIAGLVEQLPIAGPEHAVVVEVISNLQVSAVQARRDQEAALGELARLHFGLPLLNGPVVSQGGEFLAIGVGPAAWLIVSSADADDPMRRLSSVLGEAAATTDQSGAYVGLRFVGDGVAGLLAKGALLDLSDEAFVSGSAATTQFAHVPVVLWRGPSNDEVSLLCFRSYAASMWCWLEASAFEFGLGRRG